MAQSELDALKIRRETEAVSRAMGKDDAERARAMEAVQRNRKIHERLEKFRAFGRSLASALPDDVRARVVSDLETSMSEKTIPPSLDDIDAYTLVRARVQRFVDHHAAQQSRKLERAAEEQAVKSLIQAGRSHAWSETARWHADDAQRACAEIERELKRQVRPDWAEADVRELVEDQLENWVEEDDDPELEGDEEEALDGNEGEPFEDEEGPDLEDEQAPEFEDDEDVEFEGEGDELFDDEEEDDF